MIVRILGEGQLELADDVLDHLNSLDAAVATLLDAVREHGRPLPDDALQPSDAILPASDIPLAEIRELLGDEGLIPG